jgi:hypothetical protein
MISSWKKISLHQPRSPFRSRKKNFSEYQVQLVDKPDETGREITRQVLEEMDQQVEEKRT